ncbi:MAG TPA: hypothetical protein VN578_04345 [Candidatus Binatia bacterium]|jgi:hypothetical protein|nr:hypothetical protein [Candidatus Binatia bacterium]
MKTLLLTIFAMLAAGCQMPQPVPQPLVCAGGDGSSCQQAVVIMNATYRETGLLAEKVWLDRKYPGSRETRKSTLSSAGKHYDLVELTTADGQAARVYFDTTECFAK